MSFIDCKIVLLGESSVGKTCIIKRYNNNDFNDEHLVTVGATGILVEMNNFVLLQKFFIKVLILQF